MQDEQMNESTGTNDNDDAGEVDLSTLFTPEEVTAKQEAINAAKAEEERRSALSEDELKAEDEAREAQRLADEQAKQGAPDEYSDFKFSEGVEPAVELIDEFKPFAKELNLTQEQAQQVIDFYGNKVTPVMQKKQVEAWQEQLKTWVNDAKKDKEIGGDKFDAKVLDAQRVINTEGTAELKKVFDQYGLGNHPELIRVFSRVAKYMKEDNIEQHGKTDEVKPKSFEAIALKLYNGQ